MEYILSKSTKNGKKFMVQTKGKTIHFGATPYLDFTTHKDEERKIRYLLRHQGLNENWTADGTLTPGFWSRWLLWNKPTMSQSIKDIQKRFGLKIKTKGI